MIIENPARTSLLIEQLLAIWQNSVIHTHHFLDDKAIIALKPYVKNALQEIKTLIIIYDQEQPFGFMGIEKNKIEMLFLQNNAIRKGFGKKLISKAIKDYNVKYVDVNEQNSIAIAFYQHFGFSVFKRQEVDGLGKPYPILNLQRQLP